MKDRGAMRVWRAVMGKEGPVAVVEDIESATTEQRTVGHWTPEWRPWKMCMLPMLKSDGPMKSCRGKCVPGAPCKACQATAATWWYESARRQIAEDPDAAKLVAHPRGPKCNLHHVFYTTRGQTSGIRDDAGMLWQFVGETIATSRWQLVLGDDATAGVLARLIHREVPNGEVDIDFSAHAAVASARASRKPYQRATGDTPGRAAARLLLILLEAE